MHSTSNIANIVMFAYAFCANCDWTRTSNAILYVSKNGSSL